MAILSLSQEKEKIDIVIPYHEKDKDVIKFCIESCRKHIGNSRDIYVVTSVPELDIQGVKLIHEDSFFKNHFSSNVVRDRCSKISTKWVERAGWLYQQFIKIGSAYLIENLSDNYIVIDGDVIFLKKTNFFENNKTLLVKGRKCHEPYFKCYERLLGEVINRKRSFVAHHMVMNKSIMNELISKIESRFNKKWYEAILDNLDYTNFSPFSEYEMYGHYLQNNYPEKFVLVDRTWAERINIQSLLGVLFNQKDFLVLHHYKTRKQDRNFKVFRKLIALKNRT